MKVKSTNYKISRCLLYVVLLLLTAAMLVPFVWMLSASLKLDKDVFRRDLGNITEAYEQILTRLGGIKHV